MPEPLEIVITPTPELVIVGDSMARVWKGLTTGGVECRVLVVAVATRDDADQAELARALSAIPSPLKPGEVLR